MQVRVVCSREGPVRFVPANTVLHLIHTSISRPVRDTQRRTPKIKALSRGVIFGEIGNKSVTDETVGHDWLGRRAMRRGYLFALLSALLMRHPERARKKRAGEALDVVRFCLSTAVAGVR